MFVPGFVTFRFDYSSFNIYVLFLTLTQSFLWKTANKTKQKIGKEKKQEGIFEFTDLNLRGIFAKLLKLIITLR